MGADPAHVALDEHPDGLATQALAAAREQQPRWIAAAFGELRPLSGKILADRCDGVRCDMAMLVQPGVFARTWGERAKPADGSPPCDDTIVTTPVQIAFASVPRAALGLWSAYLDWKGVRVENRRLVTYGVNPQAEVRAQNVSMGPDGARFGVVIQPRDGGFVSLEELHLPMPGQHNVLRFTAKKAGIYRGECAEYCGIQHAHMDFLVIADDPGTFERWATRHEQIPSPPDDEQPARVVIE